MTTMTTTTSGTGWIQRGLLTLIMSCGSMQRSGPVVWASPPAPDAALGFEGHWESNWDFGPGVVHVLSRTGQSYGDDRAELRGSGRIVLGDGVMKMTGRPRYYIDNSDIGWTNVEMTGYATWANDGTPNSMSGFTMGARSSHDMYSHDGCTAFGYYAKIYRSSGQCSFQKEYYHDDEGTTVYSTTKRTDCLTMDDFDQGRTIGMKFTVTTLVDDTHRYADGSVELRMFLDRVGDGSTWELVHEYIDQPGQWNAAGGKVVPEECPHRDGDTVLGAGNICFFRSDGSSATEVQWRNASIANRFAFCIPEHDACNEDWDCCSAECDELNGQCVGESLLPLNTGVDEDEDEEQDDGNDGEDTVDGGEADDGGNGGEDGDDGSDGEVDDGGDAEDNGADDGGNDGEKGKDSGDGDAGGSDRGDGDEADGSDDGGDETTSWREGWLLRAKKRRQDRRKPPPGI